MNATLRVFTDPMPGAAPAAEHRIRTGQPIAWLVPDSPMPVVVRVDGRWVLRRELQRAVEPGSVIELHVRPQGGEGSSPLRIILTIALIVAANVYGAQVAAAYGATAGAAASAAITVVGTLAINAIVPVEGAGQPNLPGAAKETYSTSLSGNVPRPGDPIPCLYGFNRNFPPFAAEPYFEYQPSADGSIDDQFYCALFCLGHGWYTNRGIEIDDTPIGVFRDVEVEWLNPGQLPTIDVKANVVSAIEVSGEEIKSARFSGPYNATRPKTRARELAFDIAFNGLGVADTDGNGPAIGPKTVTLRFDVREINDFGRAIGPWQILATVPIQAATQSAVRRTFRYAISPAKRLQVRVARLDIFQDDTNVMNKPLWAGLRAVVDVDAPLAPTATHIAVRMRASEQLNGLSQRRFAVKSLRRLNVWDGEAWSAEPVETRSIAWAQADKWRSTVYGDGLSDDRIDLDTLLALDEVWAQRQDRFDFVFDSRLTSIEADQLILGCGRAAPVERMGLLTVVRDEPRALPLTGFGAGSIRPGTMSIRYAFATDTTPDGLILEYLDNRRWATEEIECPCPGVTVMQRPQRFQARGITGFTHAKREGLFLAAAMMKRRKSSSWSTELLGTLPHYGALVAFAPALQGSGISADVVDYDGAARVITLSEPLTFRPGENHFLMLQRDDGSLTPAMPVLPAGGAYELQLEADPDFELVLDDPDRERPKAFFGSASSQAQRVLVRGIARAGEDEQGTPIVSLTAINDDPSVHLVDNGLLPAPGVVQDPIEDEGGGDNGGGEDPGLPDVISVAQMPDQYFVQAFEPPDNANRRRYVVVGLAFEVDGFTSRVFGRRFINEGEASSPPTLTRTKAWSQDFFQSRWERFAPHEPAVGALYQIRFRLSRAFPPDPNMPKGDALNVWHTLNARREVQLHFDESSPDNDPFIRTSNEVYRRLRLTVEIRETATGVVQETSVIDLFNQLNDFIPGGE